MVCSFRWNRVNRHFNVIDLAGGNLWNRHRLECDFNHSAFRIRPNRCIKPPMTLMSTRKGSHDPHVTHYTLNTNKHVVCLSKPRDSMRSERTSQSQFIFLNELDREAGRGRVYLKNWVSGRLSQLGMRVLHHPAPLDDTGWGTRRKEQ